MLQCKQREEHKQQTDSRQPRFLCRSVTLHQQCSIACFPSQAYDNTLHACITLLPVATVRAAVLLLLVPLLRTFCFSSSSVGSSGLAWGKRSSSASRMSLLSHTTLPSSLKDCNKKPARQHNHQGMLLSFAVHMCEHSHCTLPIVYGSNVMSYPVCTGLSYSSSHRPMTAWHPFMLLPLWQWRPLCWC